MSSLPLVEKQRLRIRDFVTVDGVALPDFDLGYECYGTLNEMRSNAILVCHYFSGNSHAAGRYQPDDPLPGWWDSLIGPDKAFDTNQFFVICCDTLVNQNLNAIATGPAAINPATGLPFAMDFPEITMRDFVNAQRQVLRHFGIESLYAVAGPSMGSMQALTWAAAYPDEVGKVIAVIPAGLSSDAYLIERTEQWATPIRLDPNWQQGQYYGQTRPEQGLQACIRQIVLDALHPDYLNPIFGRRKNEQGEFSILHSLQKRAAETAALSDPNAILYLVRANQRYDLLEDLQQGDARTITAPLLFIAAESDLLLYPERALAAANWLRTQGKTVYWLTLQGSGGHLDGVNAIAELSEEIQQFLLA